jgi:aldehyde:ferredoxin oxidoreductase
MVGGYAGKILDINLTDSSVKKTPLDYDDAKKFIGGRGLMDKLLWDRFKPGTGAFDEENLLMIFVGPLTGVLTGNRTIIRFKSPLTATATGLNLMGHTATGGNFGPELKLAGYDGIVVKGKSPTPVYLCINDENVEIRDAQHLWGRTIFATEVKIKEETDPFTRVLSIGPAGERLVRYACINQEYFYSGSRCGGGTVMGSKKLKAVAVRGTQDIPIENPEKCLALEREAIGMILSDPTTTYSRNRWGSTIANISSSDRSTGPLKNWRESYWGDDVEKGGPLQWESRCRVKNRGCYACPMPCNQLGVIREGPWAGTFDIPDYDSTDLLHPNCMVTDPNGVYALSSHLDAYGLDSVSTGNTLSWTMECYEKGILTKDDLDGVDLTWGNVPAMFKMVEKIYRREGIGDLLAEGIRIASEKVGKGSEKFAMHCKGVEWGVGGAGNNRDSRETFCYVMSDHGGVHLYGTTIEGQNRFAVSDSLTFCIRNIGDRPGTLSQEIIARAFKAATGWDLLADQEEWDKFANRVLILERVWNIREGLIPDRDDQLPDRVFEEPLTLGPKAGTPAAVYSREQFEKDKQEWYNARGCDEHGIPTKDTLKALGLEFTIPQLEKIVGT